MRNFKIILIVLTLFFVGMAILEAAKNKPDDSDWYAQIWDYASASRNPNQLWAVFKAIELKDEKEFVPALEKFLTIRRRNSPNRAQTIYTLNKLGSKNTDEDFNLLLQDKTHFSTELWPKELNEKYAALKYMNELGINISKNSVKVIKADIAVDLNLKYPFYAVNLVAGLKQNGIELSSDEKKIVEEECRKKWFGLDPEILRQSGLKPDWESITEEERMQNQNYKLRFDRFLSLILASSDEEARKRYTADMNKFPSKQRMTDVYKRIAAATLADDEAINYLTENMRFEFIYHSKPVYDLLPDQVLLKMLSFTEQNPDQSETAFLKELIKRGYEKEVYTFLDEREKVALETDFDCEEHLAHARQDPMSASFREITGALYPLALVDVDRYFDDLWNMFERISDERCKPAFARQLIQHIYLSSSMKEFQFPEEWLKRNPEKLAKLIKSIEDSGNWHIAVQPVSDDKKYNLNFNDYIDLDMARLAMMFLPEKTFDKYFSKIDEDKLTSSAYLVGNHFKAKWAYKKDQQKFYDKYGIKYN